MSNLIRYINNIFNRQGEQDIKEQLYNFCNENGLNIHGIEEAVNKAEVYTQIGLWDEVIYSKEGVEFMLNYLINY